MKGVEIIILSLCLSWWHVQVHSRKALCGLSATVLEFTSMPALTSQESKVCVYVYLYPFYNITIKTSFLSGLESFTASTVRPIEPPRCVGLALCRCQMLIIHAWLARVSADGSAVICLGFAMVEMHTFVFTKSFQQCMMLWLGQLTVIFSQPLWQTWSFFIFFCELYQTCQLSAL